MQTQPAHRPFLGLDVPNASNAEFASLAARLAVKPTVSAIFVKLDSTNALTQLRDTPSGITPFVTLEPWSQQSRWGESGLSSYSLESLIDGSHDAALVALARVIGGLHRTVYLRFAHEMNGSWYPWAEGVNRNQPGQYVLAWRHVHDLMAPYLGTGVKWVWSPNIVNDLPAGSPTPAELYPGDGYVDYLGLTGYSHGESVPATFCPTLTALAAVSAKPVLLSEVGVEGPAKAEWLSQLAPFVAANSQIAGVVYFNTSAGTTGATGNYRIDQQPADLAALNSSLPQAFGTASPSSGAATAAAGLRCS